MTSSPVLSVVVPTFNRRERLHAVLESLADQDLDQPFEVVVISDGSSDGTDEYLGNGSTPMPVTARFQHNQGPAAARNLGVETALGDIVVFIDDDVVAERAMLRHHLDAHQRLGDQAVVIGPMLTAPEFPYDVWVAWEQELLARQYRAMNAGEYSATSRQFYTGNASVRREHVLSVGGFDPRFRRAEDVELAFRLEDRGLTFEFVPEAAGLHYAERSYESWVDAAGAYGRNDVRFAREIDEGLGVWSVGEKYQRHHVAIRLFLRTVLKVDVLKRASMSTLTGVVRRSDHLNAPTRAALSAIYATEYFSGAVDELGSTAQLWEMVRNATTDASD